MSDFWSVVVVLCAGYLLVLAELVVPGGVLGILGVMLVVFGVYQAFGLSFGLGIGSIVASFLIMGIGGRLIFKNRMRRGLVLDSESAKTWKAPDQRLPELLGARGVAATPLRPSGVALFPATVFPTPATLEIVDAGSDDLPDDTVRIDVVSDSEFLAVGTPIEVVRVEGVRVVVAAAVDPADPERGSAAEEGGAEPAAAWNRPAWNRWEDGTP